jgi:PHD/YefM family antitoxin component YafN of YafNO toxin-antitoxin module
MKEALKELEAKKILQSIQSGLDDVKNGKTHSIDKLWDEL